MIKAFSDLLSAISKKKETKKGKKFSSGLAESGQLKADSPLLATKLL